MRQQWLARTQVWWPPAVSFGIIACVNTSWIKLDSRSHFHSNNNGVIQEKGSVSLFCMQVCCYFSHSDDGTHMPGSHSIWITVILRITVVTALYMKGHNGINILSPHWCIWPIERLQSQQSKRDISNKFSSLIHQSTNYYELWHLSKLLPGHGGRKAKPCFSRSKVIGAILCSSFNVRNTIQFW